MSYKESKIQGVGTIPSHWIESKWRYITNILTDYTANGSFGDLAKNVQYLNEPDYARLIRLTDLRTNLSNEGLYVNEHSYNYLKKSSLYGGEFLIANVGANAGLVLEMPVIKEKATLGPNMMMARFNGKTVDNKFMLYSANSEYIQNQLMLKATASSAQPKLNKEDFRSIEFVYPPTDEQRIIAKYLDQKTSQVDKLISFQKRKLQILEHQRQSIITEAVTKGLNPNVKMKDSGVEWIGEIPEHWEIKPLYSLYKENKLKNKGNEIKNVLSLSYGKVKRRDVESNYGLLPDSFETYQILQKDDIVLRLTDLQNDKRSLRVGLVNEEGIITSAYLGLKQSDKSVSEYTYYLLHSYDLMKVFYGLGSGVRQSMGYTEMKKLPILLPPLDEQIKIIELLKIQVVENENLIDKLKKQIEKLKEYRQALIYEAVTGKIDVRDMKLD